MNSKHLNRLLNLVRETGDRLVIADSSSDEVFAIMSLDEYENLAQLKKMDLSPEAIMPRTSREVGDMSDQEMLEKINRDIADWRGAQRKNENDLVDEELDETEEQEPEIETLSDEKELDLAKKSSFMPRVADVLNDESYRERKFDDKPRPAWVDEEDLQGVPHEEEKFYLEPVE